MRRVLVTGASGFIGRHTLARLAQRGYEVHAVARRPPADTALARWHEADLLDEASTIALMERIAPSHLLHLAWFYRPQGVYTSVENVRWVEASLQLLRAFVANGGTRIVGSGTCAEYLWADEPLGEATTPLQPSTLYGACKLAVANVAQALADGQPSTSFAWGRLFFVFGPGEHPDRLVPTVVRSLLDGREAMLSSGMQVRDFSYSEDVADGLVALLDSDVRGAVNIASASGLAVRDLALRLAERLGRPDLLRFGTVAPAADDPPRIVAATARARDELGWSPMTPLDDALDRTVAWWRSTQPSDRS